MRNEQGQTLIEILGALAVMVVILTAVAIAVTSSLNTTSSSTNQNLATQFAQQGMEMLRDFKTTNFSDFVGMQDANDNFYCLADSCTGLDKNNLACWKRLTATQCSGNVSSGNLNAFFTRQIEIPPRNASYHCGQLLEARVTVSWPDTRCAAGVPCRQVQLTECFVNKNLIPTP